MTFWRCIFFLLLAPLTATAQDAAPAPDIFSLEAGVVCPPPSVGTAPAPGTLAGTTHIIEEDPPFVSNTRWVPAVIGIGFGVKVMSTDDFGIDPVTIIVTHPPMGSGQVQIQRFNSRISGVSPSITFYQFDYSYELVPGPWHMAALVDGQVLYSVSFEVVSPREMPELADVCGYKDLLS